MYTKRTKNWLSKSYYRVVITCLVVREPSSAPPFDLPPISPPPPPPLPGKLAFPVPVPLPSSAASSASESYPVVGKFSVGICIYVVYDKNMLVKIVEYAAQ